MPTLLPCHSSARLKPVVQFLCKRSMRRSGCGQVHHDVMYVWTTGARLPNLLPNAVSSNSLQHCNLLRLYTTSFFQRLTKGELQTLYRSVTRGAGGLSRMHIAMTTSSGHNPSVHII